MLGTSAPVLAQQQNQIWDCVAGRDTPSEVEKRLTISDAVTRASRTAEANNVDLTKFQQSSICFDAIEKSWTVFFEGREPRPGNHFMVLVHDTDDVTKFMPGE